MITIENLSVSSKHHTKACILGFILILLIITPVFSYTTEVTVRRYATDGLTPINETTVDYQWMEANLPVLGDGNTYYYFQKPVYETEWENNYSVLFPQYRTDWPGGISPSWNASDEKWDRFYNSSSLSYEINERVNCVYNNNNNLGKLKGTDVKDLCGLVGGLPQGKEVKILGADGASQTLPFSAVYTPESELGPYVITWWSMDAGESGATNGYTGPDYTNGMRATFFSDASRNPYGRNITGINDMRENLPEKYWYYHWETPIAYPSIGGFTVKNVDRVYVYSNDPVPPPMANFSANIIIGHIINGNFETGVLYPWTTNGGSIYTGIYKKDTTGIQFYRIAIGNNAWIQQDVDLTGVNSIRFWRRQVCGSGKELQIFIGENLIARYNESSGTIDKYENIDLSSYDFTGTHTLKFNVYNGGTSLFTVYLDDIEDYGPGISGDAPLIVQFKDLSTKMEDTAHTSWLWDFYNNGTATSIEQNPRFTYTENGTYTVKLTATNAGGSDSEIKTDYITVGTMPPTIDIDTTGGIADWPFATGTNENTTSVNLSVTTTASSWHVAVKDALDGGKPPGSVGRMAEYTGSAYVDPGGKVLANALQVNCSGGSYVSLSGSDQNIKTGTSSGTFEYDIGLKQEIASGDPALASPNVYRILVTFTGATD